MVPLGIFKSRFSEDISFLFGRILTLNQYLAMYFVFAGQICYDKLGLRNKKATFTDTNLHCLDWSEVHTSSSHQLNTWHELLNVVS